LSEPEGHQNIKEIAQEGTFNGKQTT
jgi:hypothetical protein